MIGVALGLALAGGYATNPLGALALGALCGSAAVAPDLDIPLRLQHRGITHSLIALLLVGVSCWRIAPSLIPFVAGGYASHLALDMLTPHGIPLLYPVRRRLRLMRWRTGGRADQLLRACGVMIIALLLLQL